MIVGAGTFGASLGWWLARAGAGGDARRPVRAGRPARDVRRGVAADPLRPRAGRRLHGVGAPRPDAVAGAGGRVRRGAAGRVRAGVVRPPRGRLGGRGAATMAAQEIPHARLAPEDGAALFPSFDPGGLAFVLREPEVGILRAQRAMRALARQAVAHGASVVRGQGARGRGPRAGWMTAAAGGRRVVWACGAVARGAVPRPRRDPLRPARSCSSSTAVRPGARRRAGGTSTSSARSTARATSTGSASRPRRTSTGRRSTPTPSCRRRPPGRGGRAGVPRRAFPGAGRRAARGLGGPAARAVARRALRRRAASRASVGVAARRRRRARVQARAGDGRAGRRGARGGAVDPRAVRAGRSRAGGQAARRAASARSPTANRNRGHSRPVGTRRTLLQRTDRPCHSPPAGSASWCSPASRRSASPGRRTPRGGVPDGHERVVRSRSRGPPTTAVDPRRRSRRVQRRRPDARPRGRQGHDRLRRLGQPQGRRARQGDRDGEHGGPARRHARRVDRARASTTPFAITLGGGNDTVFGTEFADSIAPGNGDDTVHGNDGADTMIWRPGEASDVMTGGDGKDTVLDKGGNVDEQFVVKPKAGDPTRVDASRINNPFTLDIDAEKLVVNGNGGNDSITGNVGLAGLIKTEMNGGDGNDVLVGTDGDDIQRGGPGNDDGQRRARQRRHGRRRRRRRAELEPRRGHRQVRGRRRQRHRPGQRRRRGRALRRVGQRPAGDRDARQRRAVLPRHRHVRDARPQHRRRRRQRRRQQRPRRADQGRHQPRRRQRLDPRPQRLRAGDRRRGRHGHRAVDATDQVTNVEKIAAAGASRRPKVLLKSKLQVTGGKRRRSSAACRRALATEGPRSGSSEGKIVGSKKTTVTPARARRQGPAEAQTRIALAKAPARRWR